ncbi:MAG: hypothetical protein KDI92_05415 [Xanthomonadales bacterium]|nr:hypothetical protein [Xanthomonadales bacterium]
MRLRLTVPVLLLLLLASCSSDEPVDKQTRLLNTLQTMEQLIEAKSLDKFMGYINDDFKSPNRDYDKKDVERLLRIRLMRNKTIHVHQAIKRIDWYDEGDQQVEVEVLAAMAGTDFSLTDLPSLNGDLVKFVVTFKFIDDNYIITQANYQRAHPGEFIF